MRSSPILFFIVLLFHCPRIFADDFLRALPEEEFVQTVTQERYRNADAVIILKEQSYKTAPAIVWYGGVEYEGWNSTHTKVIIAKVFNERAIERYASFELTYREAFGDEITSGFEARARVLKPNGEIVEMDEEDVKIVVHRETETGDPISRKALFKVPAVSPGDVVQIEYTLTQPLSYSKSKIFYYNDRDPILFSNLYITLPHDVDPQIISIPEQTIGTPVVTQLDDAYGSGETYFWSLKNLNRIPEEPFSPPFADQSLITSFAFEPRAVSGLAVKPGWDRIARSFSEHFLNDDPVSDDRIRELGFAEKESPVTIETTDRLYSALRRMLVLDETNSPFPIGDDIETVFIKKKGDASDHAYIMMKILRQWGQDAKAVWIRDNREGIYEVAVPSIEWFDRMSVLVTINGKERVYDFDKSLPVKYDPAWYLEDASLVILGNDGCTHRVLQKRSSSGINTMVEHHSLFFDNQMQLRDSVGLRISGAPAQRFRASCYDLEESQLQTRIIALAKGNSLSTVDTLFHNNLYESPTIEMEILGRSQADAESIDSFLTIRPRNHFLRNFRDQIFSPSRLNHILLDSPFQISMDWRIDIPPGYALTVKPEDRSFSGVGKVSSRITYSATNQTIRVRCDVTFPQVAIEHTQYQKLIAVLDQITGALEGELLLKRL